MIARAGLQFGLFAFGLGFALGTIRVLLMAPQLGEGAAVGLELPVMLAACWWWAGRIVRRYQPAPLSAALAIGAIGLAVVLLGEFLVSISLFGMTPAGWLASFAKPSARLGLLAQLSLIIMPELQTRRLPRS